jgi:hypothetical protein
MSRKPIEYVFIEHYEPDEEAMRRSLERAIRQTAENRAKKQREEEKIRLAENGEK